MAKLTRPTQNKVFGSSALSAELTVFGGSTPSTNIDNILNSTEAERGWGTVGSNGFPPMEWFNALGYGLSYYAAYILQQGIAEWVSTQDYYVNSRVIGSDGKEYKSLTGTSETPNIGNDPVSDAVNWIDSFKAQIPTAINTSTAKTTIVDADEFGLWDSVSGLLRKVSFANFKLSIVAPAGHIAYFAMQTAPSGYLKANGAAVSRTSYSELFAAIGTTFGVGDGSTTFNLPDLRGEFIRSWDDARGIDSGRVFGSYQADELESHTHSITSNATNGNAGTASVYSSASAPSYTNTSDIKATGGTETRPRNIALLACIKY